MNGTLQHVIRNTDAFEQRCDFSDLQWGNLCPKDVDMFFTATPLFLDLRSKVFIFGEFKFGDAEIPKGQNRGLRALCDACYVGGVECHVLFATHNVQPPAPVRAGELPVVSIYDPGFGRWRTPEEFITVRGFCEKQLKSLGMIQ